MEPDAYCSQKTNRSGSTFYYSVLFLDPLRRRAATALHALCLELKQVVEQTADENAARIKLAWWRNEIDALRKQNAQHPVTRALLPFLQNASRDSIPLDALVDGAEMDLLQSRYLDFRAVQQYCELTGGAVIHCASALAGDSVEGTQATLRKAGTALRLISIIRNVGDHARKGRVYLPVNELQQFQVPVADVLNARYSDNFRALMEFQRNRAIKLLIDAVNEFSPPQKKLQRPLLIQAAIYRTLLEEIRSDGFNVLHQRASLTPLRKFWLAWKTWIMA